MLTRELLIIQINAEIEQVKMLEEQKLDRSAAETRLFNYKEHLYNFAVRTHLIQAIEIEIKTRPVSQLARAYVVFKRESKYE
jgi:hypothetical protein